MTPLAVVGHLCGYEVGPSSHGRSKRMKAGDVGTGSWHKESYGGRWE